MKTVDIAISSITLCLLAASVQADETIRTTNLEVKERLIAIEQINVSAEKTQVAPVITSERVAQLLEEAAEADAQSEATATDNQTD